MNAPCCVALVLCWSATSTFGASGQGTSDPAQAQSAGAHPALASPWEASAQSSSSAFLPEAPGTDETAAVHAASGGGVMRTPQSRPAGVRPFSAVAIGVRAGLSGIGLELATPLATALNLRAGGSFLNLHPQFAEDGITLPGDLQLRSGFVAVDLFPFKGGFHISPGFTLYTGNRLSAKAMVPGGQSFDLGDGTYTSGTTDPVHGTFDVGFGKRSGPRFTLGWGNRIPRMGGHWSFPLEIGAEYLGNPPRTTLTLAGTVCQGPGFCQPIDQNAIAQQNVTIEQNEINSDIPNWLRFFPLVSTGISYRFGRGAAVAEVR